MKKTMMNLLIFMLLVGYSFAGGNEIVYIEGDVTIRDGYNNWREADFGDIVEREDTIITAEDGYTEIETDYSTITIAPDTIFNFMESESGETKQDIFTCISGSVLFKIDKITGTPPLINTMSANAGVRGTEFTLFAAGDGSSLVLVTEGKVEVSAGNASVILAADEGVEVLPGETPGQKFQVLRGHQDFTEWNRQRMNSFLADPDWYIKELILLENAEEIWAVRWIGDGL